MTNSSIPSRDDVRTSPATGLRIELERLLAERGVNHVSALVDELPSVEGAVATVAYFDDQPGEKAKGLLVHLLRSGEQNGYERRRQHRRPKGVSSLTIDARAWAAEHFPEHQAVAAAGEACNLKVMGRKVTRGSVLARLRETRPELFA